jgi:hypothetical protein
MGRLARLSVCAIIVALTPLSASAQSRNRFAIGANFSQKSAPDETSRGHRSIGLLWRIGHGSSGWGWKYGINWYSTDIDRALSGGPLEAFGELRIRPFMAGYGYTKIVGRTKVSANLMAGYSFNSFNLAPTYATAYRQIHGTAAVDVDAANSLVFKPEISTWFDVNAKVGINVSMGYMVARPTVTLRTAAQRDRGRVRADVFLFKVGAVYSIF